MRAQTQSNYKDNNTSKYLIGTIPVRTISFLSLGWGGRVFDKQYKKESGFFNKISVGQYILAGFNTKTELCAHVLRKETTNFLVANWIRQDSSEVYRSM